MRLKLLELNLQCPKELSLENLRPWLLIQLSQYGEPLRWAITSIQSSKCDGLFRQLTVEAVLIIV